MKNTVLVVMAAIGLTVAAMAAWQLPHWRLYSVQTASMGKAMPQGSLVLVRRSQQPVTIGDIASYRHPSSQKMVVTHRVIGYDRVANTYLFKGDANQAADVPVPAHRLVGPVMMNLPYAGYVSDFLKTPVGLILGVYLPASLVIIYEVTRLAYIRKSYRLNT